MIFQNRTGVHVLDIVFTVPRACDNKFDHPILTKLTRMQFCFIFPMVIICFYVKVYRCYFVRITNKLFNPSRHDALQGPYVLKMTLCVTFGAPQFRTHFRSITLCLKYIVIHMVWRTHVRRTQLCATFGARPCSIPLSSLDDLFGHLGRQGCPWPPESSGTIPPSDRFGYQHRPGMPSRPYFSAPAATSKPSVGYLP